MNRVEKLSFVAYEFNLTPTRLCSEVSSSIAVAVSDSPPPLFSAMAEIEFDSVKASFVPSSSSVGAVIDTTSASVAVGLVVVGGRFALVSSLSGEGNVVVTPLDDIDESAATIDSEASTIVVSVKREVCVAGEKLDASDIVSWQV